MLTLDPIENTNRDFVGSLAKGLRVLRAFGESTDKLTVSDVAKVTDLTRAGARRLLLTLHALGYLDMDGKYYSLTPKVLELGFSYLGAQHWLNRATPLLEKLRDTLNEAVSVTVMQNTEVVYVARFQTDRVMTMAMDIGSRKPVFCTAMGRVLLASLPETKVREVLLASDIKRYTPQTLIDINALTAAVCDTRTKGYCVIDQELEQSLVAVSVPLKNYQGQTLAAVNVCGHPSNLSLEDLETRCLSALQETTQNLSQLLV